MTVDLSGIAAFASAAQREALGAGSLLVGAAAALPTAIILASAKAQRIEFAFMTDPSRGISHLRNYAG